MTKRANQLISKVLGAAPEAMLVVDGAGLLVMANTKAELLFGCSHKTMVGIPVVAIGFDRFSRRSV